MDLRYQKTEQLTDGIFNLDKIPFGVPDALRAQYFLDALTSASKPLFGLLRNWNIPAT